MQTIEELSNRWDSLRKGWGEPVYQGYDKLHPLQFFLGFDAGGNREFFLIVNNLPAQVPKRSRSIEVLSGQRKDGTYTLVFRLTQSDQHDVFTHLCWDLAESSRDYRDKEQGLARVMMRYAHWQRLMEKGINGLLSESKIKGLFGEILLLKDILVKKYGYFHAVQGWLGPKGADRDFVYGDLWYEVKTTNPSSSILQISSVEQLDTDEIGRLVWIKAEKTTVLDSLGLSLPALIAATRDTLANEPTALDHFEALLMEAGYINRVEYNDYFFVFSGMKQYWVGADFPRIHRQDLNAGICSAHYDISIAYIAKYEVAWEE
jgi:hypothetical protein